MQPPSPTRESQLTLAAREEIDRLCEQFESQWRTGKRPEIQASLDVASAGARAALLRELVAIELEYRRRAGESPNLEEYVARFPSLAASIAAKGSDSLDSESLVGTRSRTATFRPESVTEPQAGAKGERVEMAQPETVGRYEIRRLLGRGAFGAVYLGWDPQLERQVAIKAPRLAVENTEAQIESFLSEARRAVQLERHPGIVPVYDVGRDGDLCYIVAQYIEGGTLTQLIKSGPPAVEKTLPLMMTLADVVQFAHAQGWVHRDIKPSNILLDLEGKPYLADFGLTSRLDDMRSAEGPPNGTPNYMAPELAREALAQIRRQAAPAALRPDQRSDVYSLGVVLYQLLTGRVPFEAETLEALFDLVLHSDPVPPRLENRHIPRRLEEICLKALAKDPAERYRTAADLREDLSVVAMAVRAPDTQVKVHDQALWGLTPPRLALAVGAGVLLCGLAMYAIWAATQGWRKPVDHTSGGETNVAVLDNRARDRAPAAAGGPRDREELVGALREILSEASRPPGGMGGRGGFGGGVESENSAAKRGVLDAPSPPVPGGPEGETPAPFVAPLVAADKSSLDKKLYLQPQIDEARAKGDAKREHTLLLRATNELLEQGRAEEAERAALRMIDLPVGEPFSYGQLGLAQAALDRHEDALISQGKALVVFREMYEDTYNSERADFKAIAAPAARLLALTLGRMATAHKHLSQFDESDRYYLEAEKVLSAHEELKPELMGMVMNRASLLSIMQRHKEAKAQFERALKLAVEQHDTAAEAEILISLGKAQSRAGQDAQALLSFSKADELLPRDASYQARSRLMGNWSLSLIAEGKYAEARQKLLRLREFARPEDEQTQRLLQAAAPLLKEEPAGEEKK